LGLNPTKDIIHLVREEIKIMLWIYGDLIKLIIIGLMILYIIVKIKSEIAPTKYINVDTGIFDNITYKITTYDDLETAKSKSHFKTTIYEVPEYLLDKMNQILNSQERQGMKLNDAWCAEEYLLDNNCKVVYINRNYF
jgi:hypothetical protein